MIKFFRKIRQNLISEGKTVKYLKYAIGEIVLVVIGILIALSINNWNEDRKSTKHELKLLVDLQKSISSDYNLTEAGIKGNERVIQSCQIILSQFDQNLPYQDSLALHFETTHIWWKPILRQYAYQNAKDYGLNFIVNDSTREILTTLFEQYSSFANTLDERYSSYYYNTVTPILTELFKSINHELDYASSGNVPNDFETLRNDKRYRNILNTIIGNRKVYNRYMMVIMSTMKDLEMRIDEEIDRYN